MADTFLNGYWPVFRWRRIFEVDAGQRRTRCFVLSDRRRGDMLFGWRFCPPFTNNKTHLYKTRRNGGILTARCDLILLIPLFFRRGGGLVLICLHRRSHFDDTICTIMELPAGYAETFKYF